jgi:hypothetical protein
MTGGIMFLEAGRPDIERDRGHFTPHSHEFGAQPDSLICDQQHIAGVGERPGVTQAAIDYTPICRLAMRGLSTGALRCAFDNLQAIGTPSDRLLVIHLFCNCRRTAYGANLELRWRWMARTPAIWMNSRAVQSSLRQLTACL